MARDIGELVDLAHLVAYELEVLIDKLTERRDGGNMPNQTDELQLNTGRDFSPTWELVLRHRVSEHTEYTESMILFDEAIGRMVTPLPEVLKQVLEIEYQAVLRQMEESLAR